MLAACRGGTFRLSSFYKGEEHTASTMRSPPISAPLVRTCYGSSEGVAAKRSDAVGGDCLV